MIKIDNKKFVWFPELKEKVIVKKRYLPELLRGTEETVYAKIVEIDGQYISVKYIGHSIGIGEHYRNELKPYGIYKQIKSKKK